MRTNRAVAIHFQQPDDCHALAIPPRDKRARAIELRLVSLEPSIVFDYISTETTDDRVQLAELP
jgi:hypothetical protein